jgi:hypothetical protein
MPSLTVNGGFHGAVAVIFVPSCYGSALLDVESGAAEHVGSREEVAGRAYHGYGHEPRASIEDEVVVGEAKDLLA